jgi:hypothetical protein
VLRLVAGVLSPTAPCSGDRVALAERRSMDGLGVAE